MCFSGAAFISSYSFKSLKPIALILISFNLASLDFSSKFLNAAILFGSLVFSRSLNSSACIAILRFSAPATLSSLAFIASISFFEAPRLSKSFTCFNGFVNSSHILVLSCDNIVLMPPVCDFTIPNSGIEGVSLNALNTAELLYTACLNILFPPFAILFIVRPTGLSNRILLTLSPKEPILYITLLS